MKNIKRFLVTSLSTCGVVLTLLAIPAHGQGLGIEKGPYLNFGAGMNFMSAEINADVGFRLSAAAGYNFNKWIGLEFETGFLYNSFSPESSWFGRGEDDDGGSLGQVPFVLNFVVRYENESKFVPYVGFGLGGVLMFAEGEDDTGFDFTYQPMFGLRYEINENMSVGLGYKYLGYASTVLWGFQLGNHAVMAEFGWKF
jgi:opacity protein-like surface antigen